MFYMLFCRFKHYPSTYILIPNTLLPFFLILLPPFYTIKMKNYILFSQTQALTLSRTEPFFIAHIHAHSGLPGPLVTKNDAVDRLIAPIFTSANDEHANLHTNANRLHSKYHIPLTETWHIIKTYDVCAPLHLHTTISGVNPHGQQPNSLWQSDFTHCSLGKFFFAFCLNWYIFGFYMGSAYLFRIQQTHHFCAFTHLPCYGDTFGLKNR